MARAMYHLPLPPTQAPTHLHVSHDLVPVPGADFTDDLMDAQYLYHSPYNVPPRSLRVCTLNVNGALYQPEPSTTDLLSHLMDVVDISILGITDARISDPFVDSTKSLLRRALSRGMAIIPFCTERPSVASHRNTTMGGQLILINGQWEKWAGHHRSDPSGLSLVVGLRLTYQQSVLSIIQVMVPPKSLGPHTMWQRLLKYLKKSNSHLRPGEYVTQTDERWATEDSRTVLVMGDSNKSIAAHSDWSAINGLSSMSRELSTAKPGNYFASFNGTTYSYNKEPTSVGGLMNPLIPLLTDHNPSWVGIRWPETPPQIAPTTPSPWITNFPDLPMNSDTLAHFASDLDAKLTTILRDYPPLDDITPEAAGVLQGVVV